jgi:hypothetical protein
LARQIGLFTIMLSGNLSFTPNYMQRRQFISSAISTCTAAIVLNGCNQKTPKHPPQNMLFLGNGMTYSYQMPSLLQQLATADQQQTWVQQVASPGWTLARHVNDPASTQAIAAQKWQYVVLQEKTTIAAASDMRQEIMFPAIRSLTQQIITVGAKPILFLTWGRQQGQPEASYRDYSSHQQAIVSAYMTIAAELDLPIAPVGVAWHTIVTQYPQIQLWSKDGHYPSLAGAFLAACVFYAAVYRHSPQGINYHAGLDPKTAEILQEVAGKTVMQHRQDWRL